MKRRSIRQKALDFVSFPIRALLFHDRVDKYGLTSLASERYYYVLQHVKGYGLDVGCGPGNRFVTEFLNGLGKGIDIFPYEGLTKENVVRDIRRFPFPDNSFQTVTFIANLNHIPKFLRDIELAEAFRVLKSGGNIVVTMGRPAAEILVHKLCQFTDRWFKTNFDFDLVRGMHDEEDLYVSPDEIECRLRTAGFVHCTKKLFWTQWCMNQLFVAYKFRE